MTRTAEPFNPASVRHVLQGSQVKHFLGALAAHQGPVVLDLETTGLNEFSPYARVVTLAATLPIVDDRGEEVGYPLTYVVGLSHPDAPMHRRWREILREIARVILRRKLPIIGQNIRFDVRWIKALTGVDLGPLVLRDTGLGSHLLNENATAALKDRACAMFGIDKWIDFDWKIIEKQQLKDPDYPRCPLLAERVDYFVMAMYNARDTYWTWRVDQIHTLDMGLRADCREELMAMGDRDSTNALRLGQYYTEVGMRNVKTLIDIETHGMKLDRLWCEERLASLDLIVVEAHAELEELYLTVTGDKPEDVRKANKWDLSYAGTALWFLHWSEVMCQAKKLRVLDLTPQGRPSWAKEVLDRLGRMGYEAAVALRKFRKAAIEASYIRSWFEHVGPDGRIHTSYNYFKVVTGRLSSENPNAQQIPKSAKNAFTAAEGNLLITADYSQIELRVAAHLAQCRPMIDAFNQGMDLHRLMGSLIAQVPVDSVTPEQRQRAKAANFGFLFGMSAEKFVKYAEDLYGVTFTEEEAVEIRVAFFDTWEGLQDWHQAQQNAAAREGYVKSPLGRLRRLPAVWSGDGYKRAEAGRQAINSPVQAMASDTMLLAASEIRQLGYVQPVALIHDAILAEVPIPMAEQAAREVKALMETGVHPLLRRLGCDFSVPLVADVAIGPTWGACEPIAA